MHCLFFFPSPPSISYLSPLCFNIMLSPGVTQTKAMKVDRCIYIYSREDVYIGGEAQHKEKERTRSNLN